MSPSSNGIVGSQFNKDFANDMSGHRRNGSSCNCVSCLTDELVLVSSLLTWRAHSWIGIIVIVIVIVIFKSN